MLKEFSTLILLSLFLTVNSHASKKTVCAITINSSDEKAFFQKNLSADEFNFIELVPNRPYSASSDPNWLKDSCRPDIQCDVLLISGHFAGSFFGKEKYSLSLENMEELSCNSACSGIFRKPKEVYLLGCNTLAGKDKDSRTPEQYYRDLLADDIGTIAAQQAVALRYSPLGNSNVERMQRVFAGVPRIYGYQSKGPLGAQNKLLLPKLFNEFGNYNEHLNKVEQEKQSFQSTGQAPVVDPKGWLIAMAGKKPGFCSGSSTKDSNLDLICKIHTPNHSIEERISALYQLLSGADGKKYILVAHAFIQKNINQLNSYEALDQLAKIKALENIEEEVGQMIPLFESSLNLRLKLLELQFLIGWSSIEQFEAAAIAPIKKLVSGYATYPLSKTICEYDHYSMYRKKYGFNLLVSKDFHPSFYENSSGLDSLSCLRIADEEHVNKLFHLVQDKNNPLFFEALDTLGISETQRPDVQQFFRRLLFSEDPNDATAGLLGSARVGLTTDADVDRIINLMSHSSLSVSTQASTTYNYMIRVNLIKRR